MSDSLHSISTSLIGRHCQAPNLISPGFHPHVDHASFRGRPDIIPSVATCIDRIGFLTNGVGQLSGVLLTPAALSRRVANVIRNGIQSSEGLRRKKVVERIFSDKWAMDTR